MGRRAAAVAASLLIGVVGIACEPPPPPTFTVSTVVDGHDGAVGDGVCEMTPGAGDCSIRAGIEEAVEASATSVAAPVVIVPSGTYDVSGPIDITGRVHLRGTSSVDATVAHDGIEVVAGASLTVELLTLERSAFALSLQVDGTVVLRRSVFRAFSPSVVVGSTGVLVSDRSSIHGAVGTTISNAGIVAARSSTVTATLASIAIDTTGDGATYLRSTSLLSPLPPRGQAGGGTACIGTLPVSFGHNTAWGTSCGFTSVGDVQDVNPYEGPIPGSALLDAIPIGVDGCGTTSEVDRVGTIRPVDGDGDGVAACDIGDIERPAP